MTAHVKLLSPWASVHTPKISSVPTAPPTKSTPASATAIPGLGRQMEQELQIAQGKHGDDGAGRDHPAVMEDAGTMVQRFDAVEPFVDLDELVDRHVAENRRKYGPMSLELAGAALLVAAMSPRVTAACRQQERRPPGGHVLLFGEAEVVHELGIAIYEVPRVLGDTPQDRERSDHDAQHESSTGATGSSSAWLRSCSE